MSAQIAQLTKQLAEQTNGNSDLSMEKKVLKAEIERLNTATEKYQERLSRMTLTSLYEETVKDLNTTQQQKSELEEELSQLQGEMNTQTVAATELGENYKVIRTEFKLLLSQPQFKNIRVNNKISRLLNETTGPSPRTGTGTGTAVEAESTLSTPTAAHNRA